MDIAKLLQESTDKYKDKPAIFFKGKEITFIELRDNVFKLTNALGSLGLKKHDKVAIYLPNCPQYIYTYLAIWCSCATAVPLDFMLTEEELISCIDHSEAKIIIAKKKSRVSFSDIKNKCKLLQEVVLLDEGEEFVNFNILLNNVKEDYPKAECSDKDYSIIFYTSGTTGKPKGVLINYAQIAAPAMGMKHFVGLNDKDIALCAIPLSHLGGLVFLQSIIFLGTTVVLMERFMPVEFLKNITEYKVTCFWIVPSMYYAILQLKEFESYDLSSLQWVVSFGAPSSAEQLRRFHKYCPQAEFVNGWGMTETNAPSVVIPKGSKKLESVGLPAPWVELKILDSNNKEVKKTEVGEIVVKGWVVTDGYYKDDELTKQTKRNGWFYTGDLGRLDTEGYLYICGRKKEMIKVGGEIVFEPEVEAALHKHPAVSEVAVIGVKDKLRTEVPKAFIVLKEDTQFAEEEIVFFLKKHLAHFKIPHYFEVLDTLPKTRSGKVDKKVLRDR
ncbi:MAG: class I adenylate-forming enzyme family protein [Candidatus Gygaella obscura]|nr:class I adenylate-forming enzyme family protein [Candidatus Gygaella obscura]